MTDLTGVLQRGATRVGLVLPQNLIRFVGVGLAGLAVHSGLFTGLFWLGAAKPLAWLIGMLSATAVTWALNRRFTFGSSGRRRRHELLRYLLVTAVAQGISFAVFYALVIFMPMIFPTIDTILGAVVATAFSYTGQRFFTFSRVDVAESPASEPQSPSPKA